MKKLVSLAAALTLCLSMAGSAASFGVVDEGAVMTASAEDASALEKILPKKLADFKAFVEKNGNVSVQDGCLVYCGNVKDAGLRTKFDCVTEQSGTGKFKLTQQYAITDDGPEDGSANIVMVYKPTKAGAVNITSEYETDEGEYQCLIQRSCVIGEDMSVTLKNAPSMENLIYTVTTKGCEITKAHEQLKGKLIIPEKMGGVPVKSIPEGFLKYYDGITSVTLPETIDEIPEGAFELCYDMETVTITNPKCKIADSEKTISNVNTAAGAYAFTGTIRGYEGSTAEKYAKKYGYDFEAIKDEAAIDESLEKILPKTRTQAVEFCDKYGTVSVHGKYVVTMRNFSSFYNNGGPGFKGFETQQKGTGGFKLVKCYDMGDTLYNDDAMIIMIYEAETAGDVELFACYNSSSTAKNCVIHRNYTIAKDMTVTEKPVADNMQNGESTYYFGEDGKVSILAGCSGMTELIVPTQIMDYNVTRIAEDSYSRVEGLKKVVIPADIEYIGANVFAECPDLESVTILNPNCKIELEGSIGSVSDTTICNYLDEKNGWKRVYNGVIYGYKGSTAEEFAKYRGYTFKAIDEDAPAETDKPDGDVNGDGETGMADMVLLQKWLMGAERLLEKEVLRADLNEDGTVDSFDLCLMRKKLEANCKFVKKYKVVVVNKDEPVFKELELYPEKMYYIGFKEYVKVKTPDGEDEIVNLISYPNTNGKRDEYIIINGEKWADSALEYRVEVESVGSPANGADCKLLEDKTETINGVTYLYVKIELIGYHI